MQALTNQEFTYRQSPAEQDGYGKFKALYGNTIVWNQLVHGEFGSNYTDYWSVYRGTGSVSNGELTVTDAVGRGGIRLNTSATLPLVTNHKYFISLQYKSTVNLETHFVVQGIKLPLSSSYKTYSSIVTHTGVEVTKRIDMFPEIVGETGTFSIKNVMCLDLSQMFGLGNEPTTVEEFTSLFSKPYYDYCQGAMLSFGGRNVKFNQIMRNGNFTYNSAWVGQYTTVSISNGVANVTLDVKGNYVALRQNFVGISKEGHKYFVTATVKSAKKTAVGFYLDGNSAYQNGYDVRANTQTTVSSLIDGGASGGFNVYVSRKNELEIGDVVQVSNVMLVDLTEMFGVGNEPSAEGFKELFPNDYYEYTITSQYMNIGQPVSLKTVGKNLFDFSKFANGAITFENGVLTGTAVQFYTAYRDVVNNGIELKYPKNTQITISFDARTEQNDLPTGGGLYFVASENGISVQLATTFNNTTAIQHITVTIPSNRHIDKLGWTYGSNGLNIWHITNFQVEFGTTETSYEPYTSSTLPIPLDEFPDGMDGFNDVRDEKNETGYAKRLGIVDLGSLEWSYNSTYGMYSTGISNSVKKPSASSVRANAISSVGTFTDWATFYASGTSSGLWAINTSGYIGIATTETNSTTFKNSVKGKYLVYELATPLENYGVVDLGSLEWVATDSSANLFRCQPTGMNYVVSPPYENRQNGAVCYKYSPSQNISISSSMNDKSWLRAGYDFYVRDTSYSDAVAFKQAMQGVYLLYEKKNTQGLAYPPQSKEEYPFFKSYKGGTEQLLPENGSVPVTAPILADMKYSSGAIEVTTFPNPEQGGETSGDGWYLVGEEATVNAMPNEHYAFNNWVLDGEIVSTDPEYTFEVQDE